jgi:hypothetical protein
VGSLEEGGSPVKDLGYYFTDWIWQSGSIDFMKSMLLFFDGLTLALPSDIAAETIDRDPVLATPLAELGLLVNFDPVSTLDKDSAELLAVALTKIAQEYPLRTQNRLFLTATHWGRLIADPETVVVLEHALIERGLIIPRAEFGSPEGLYSVNRGMRILILALFAQTLRGQLAPRGINLHLATDSHSMVSAITSELQDYAEHNPVYLGRPLPDYWDYNSDALNPLQLTDDLCNVGVDLSAVPLDEVLSFREQNGQHYRAYARGLRELLATLGQADPTERPRILHERAADIQDQASDLRRASRAAFGTRMATLLVSLAGAAWTVHTGDPVGAILAGASAGLQAAPAKDRGVTAYSYLLKTADLGRG